MAWSQARGWPVSCAAAWLVRAVSWVLMLDLRAQAKRWDQKAHWNGNMILLALGLLALSGGDGGWPVAAWLVLVVILGRLSLRASVRASRSHWRRWLLGDEGK
jgi:hypothetical protein